MKKILNVFLIILVALFISTINVKAGELDDIFQEVAHNNVFTINFRKPTNDQELNDYSTTYINEKYKDYSGFLSECDANYTNCRLCLTKKTAENVYVSDNKEVQVVWNEEYSELFKKVLSKDDILKINFRKPKDINFANNYFSAYLENLFDNKLIGHFSDCNADYSKCMLTLNDMTKKGTNGTTYYSESNVVDIVWNEEYSEDFKNIAPNNVVTVKNMKQFDEHNYYSTSYFDKLYPNVSGTFSNCNADYSVCDLALYKNYKGFYSEIHQVKVIWNEEYSELFNSIAPNGVFNIKSIKPQNDDDLDLYSIAAINQMFKNVMGNLDKCNKDYTECTLAITDTSNTEDPYFQIPEQHRVKVVWEKENPIVRKLVDAAVATVKLGAKNFIGDESEQVMEYYHILEDLNLINYLKYQKSKNYVTDVNVSINFVPALKLLFNNTNITYNLDSRLGDANYFYDMNGGVLSLLYKGTVYAIVNPYNDAIVSFTSVHRNYILYIPSDTANNKDAYIKAAKERLDKYLNEDVKVEVGGLLKDYTYGEKLSIPFFNAKESQIGDYYYKITINGIDYDFLIVRDTSRMIVNNLVKSIDVDTNVKVETTATDIPNDVVINVTKVTKEDNIYNKIIDTIKTEAFQAFDINLYSPSLSQNITKTETGEFKITLPIADNLKGKNLIVYYIKDDSTLEEHPVTLDEEGNATFTTNHFSTYILAEAKEEVTNNVQTGTVNPLMLSLITITSLVSAIYVGKILKKQYAKKEN